MHKDFQVSWEIFGRQITIELAGQVNEDEYMAFGISGSEQSSQMLGSDVAVAYIDGYRGFTTDYNITALSPVKESSSVLFTNLVKSISPRLPLRFPRFHAAFSLVDLVY